MTNRDPNLNAALTNTDRLEEVYNSNLLDSPAEQIFDRVTNSICEDLEVPISLVSIVDVDRQYFKSAQGLSEDMMQKRETPLSHSLCKYVVERAGVLKIDDMRDYPNLKDHPALIDYKIFAYLGVPLIKNDQVLGSLCAVDQKPRSWTDKEIAFLEAKANFISAEIYLRDKIQKA